jgi:hypothetical protein
LQSCVFIFLHFSQAYAARALAPPKQVVHANTRLARTAFAPNTAVGAAHGGRSSSHADPNGARIGVSSFDSIVGGGGGGSAGFDGGNGTPRINGFTLPGTPAIAPGADGASPLITWGMIVGTPQHIVAEDPAESLMQREMAGAGNGTRRARKTYFSLFLATSADFFNQLFAMTRLLECVFGMSKLSRLFFIIFMPTFVSAFMPTARFRLFFFAHQIRRSRLPHCRAVVARGDRAAPQRQRDRQTCCETRGASLGAGAFGRRSGRRRARACARQHARG